MSQFTLYAASAPVFVRSLSAMRGWLDKAEAYAGAKKFDTGVFCNARLAPDMLALTGQIHLTTAFAKNAVCRLANKTPPDFSDLSASFDAYRARIEETVGIIRGIKESDYAGAETRELSVRTGPDTNTAMSGSTYLLYYSLPQFYFHLTTAYDILRHNGVDLSKRDFLA